MHLLKRMIAALGEKCATVVMDLGGVTRLTCASLARLPSGRFEFRLMLNDLEMIGWQSTGVIAILGFFVGMVLVVSTGETLRKFGAQAYVSDGVALAMVREMGPVLAGFLLAGRVGSGIAAEIGSMKIGEQIDAMRSLGADPLRKLALPKAVAAVIGLPLLTTIANILGIFGGMIMAMIILHIKPNAYMYRVLHRLTVSDFIVGISKTAVFGLIIAMVGCYFGFRTEGGTVGVGRSATRSVVLSCIMILLADLLIGSMLFVISDLTTK